MSTKGELSRALPTQCVSHYACRYKDGERETSGDSNYTVLPDSVEEATGEWYVLPENGSILDEVFIILESLFTITNTLVHALPLPPCAEMRKSSEACISPLYLPPSRLSVSSLGQCSRPSLTMLNEFSHRRSF